MLVFVGTYTRTSSKGVYVLRMDESTGELTHLSDAGGGANPSFAALHPNGKYLYAVNEAGGGAGPGEGAVTAYSIGVSGALTLLNTESVGGPGPCHLQVDATGRYVCTANYGGGSVAMLPLNDDGTVAPLSDFHQHGGPSRVNQQRQRAAHAHSINLDPANRFAFVPDLGQDKVVTYRLDLDNGKLAPHDPPFVETAPGAGPRHFEYHPNGRLAFVINELGCTITSYRYDSAAGALTEIESVPTLPDEFTGSNTTADVHVSPDGQFVYGSNRGHNSLVIYRLDQDSGRMSFVGHESTRGRTPRNFGIDPSGRWVLAANQDSDNIVTFRRDASTGRLEATGAEIEAPMPVCLKFMPEG